MKSADAEQVLNIYAYGLATRDATFETRVPDWREWNANHHATCRLVFDHAGKVIAWFALSPMSRRHCYRGVAEVSVYVAAEFSGRGIGSQLLQRGRESEKNDIWTYNIPCPAIAAADRCNAIQLLTECTGDCGLLRVAITD